MMRKAAVVGLLAVMVAGAAWAQDGDGRREGVPHLDHVFVIMMENHGYAQILNNPNAPFINQLAQSSGYATNYFAIGHPSSTNYLELHDVHECRIRIESFDHEATHQCGRGSNVSEQTGNNVDIERIVFLPC
jgi:hypothetical protein